ncbi:dipeptide ABC transporter ATP-binding protein [bacterium]|nr:dipeptide ABC transporter ATP-binding protein [bacterium]
MTSEVPRRPPPAARLFGRPLGPLGARRLALFRANRRGRWSAWIFAGLLVASLGAELVANDRPLVVSYDGEIFFPFAKAYPETDFGGFLETEADYSDPEVRRMIGEKGWILDPPIPFRWDTVVRDLPGPAPSAPSARNWLGTDDQARDVAARLVYGYRLSVVFGLVLTLLSSIVGIAAGAVQGYFGGWVDLALQRFIEVWSGMPTLYLLIILASVVTPGFGWLLLLMLLFSWMTLVGVVRAEFLRARNFDYVRAARALGVGDASIMVRHVLPNAMTAALTFLPFVTSGAVVTLTSLDFLGFGMPPGAPSLGELLKQGKDNPQAPWLGFTSFFVIAGMLSLLVFIGEAVRDAFDPRRGLVAPGAGEDAAMTLGPLEDPEEALVPPGLPGGAVSEALPRPVGRGAEGRGESDGASARTGDAPRQDGPEGRASAGSEPLVDSTLPGQPLLRVEDLGVRFGHGPAAVDAVRGVSFDVGRGETVALVGESGSGKSVTALSILRLLPSPNASHPSGRILLDGEDLLRAPGETLRRVRGGRVGMVFQEPMTSLNPLHTVERQVGETLVVHRGADAAAARARSLELLELVGLNDAERRLASYPHEMSGGQRQRVMIAMALANEPDLLIADEPTTAVDVTIQAQLLELLAELRRRLGMAMLFITHDLGIVRRVADRVCVMRHGRIVEAGPVERVFGSPRHPYTRALLAAEPRGVPTPVAPDAPVVASCRDLKVWYPIRKGLLRRTVDHVRAVDGVSIEVREGETVGLVGESGSGKTTIALAMLRLAASRGEIRFRGETISSLGGAGLRPLRREMQIVFQDPYGSLSPRLSVGQIVAEGLRVHGLGRDEGEREERVVRALEAVEIDPAARHRHPHELSGGQRQRVAIARAIVLEPRLVVLDEPTSALDVSVQAQIVGLLRRLQEERRLAYLFISHDLRVVRAMSHRIVVLADGKVVEQGPAAEVFGAPREDYTRRLLEAALHLATPRRPPSG